MTFPGVLQGNFATVLCANIGAAYWQLGCNVTLSGDEDHGIPAGVFVGQRPGDVEGGSSRDSLPRVSRAHLLRAGFHCVLATPKHRETIDWFSNTLGLIKTDDLYMGAPDNVFGSFSRVDMGDEPVDHHVFFCFKGDRAGLHRASFEVADVNDVFVGHNHLHKQGYEHIRGVGRHALGSQIFDYWVSPFDQMHELWSSNEKFTASSGSGAVGIGPA